MRIYAVADIHGRADKLRQIRQNILAHQPDVLVVAGDITGFFRPAPVIAKLNDMPVPVLAVRGNSDLGRVDPLLEAYPGTASLHLRSVTLNGFRFVGAGGTVPVPFRSRISFREKCLLEQVAALSDHEAVLVVHSPPWGILDQVGGKFHAGSKGLADFIAAHSPALVICGHIHEDPGAAFMGRTLVVNCALSRKGQGAMIDMEPGQRPAARML